MTLFVRFSKDPTAPAALRDALERAASETATPDVLSRVLGAAAGAGVAGAGVIATAGTRVLRAAPAASGLSVAAAKGALALAIFAGGAVAGGFAVHHHDLRTAAFAVHTAPAPDERVSSSSGLAQATEQAAIPAPTITPPVADSSSAAIPAPAEVALPRTNRAPGVRTRTPAAAETLSAFAPVPPGAGSEEAPTHAPAAREELTSLRGIRDAVDGDRAHDALVAIEAHRTRFPRSVFDEELLLLEAEARWATRDPSACKSIDRLLANHPRSLLGPRAQALRARAGCGGVDRN